MMDQVEIVSSNSRSNQTVFSTVSELYWSYDTLKVWGLLYKAYKVIFTTQEFKRLIIVKFYNMCYFSINLDVINFNICIILYNMYNI